MLAGERSLVRNWWQTYGAESAEGDQHDLKSRMRVGSTRKKRLTVFI